MDLLAAGCLVLSAAVAATACVGRASLDEFTVISRPPLTLPPGYHLRPGSDDASLPDEQAAATLTGSDAPLENPYAPAGDESVAATPASAGEQALLEHARRAASGSSPAISSLTPETQQ